jgi:hypothetical protein
LPCGPVDAPSLGLGNSFHLSLTPQTGLELGKHAQHVEERLAAAVEVSMGWSVTLRATPWDRSALTMSCKSPTERASLSTFVTINVSPGRRNVSNVSSSVLPSRLAAHLLLAHDSAAAFNFSTWMLTS